jgi:predicted lipoprotein with Yx(FWY)xxD motif
MRTNHVIAVTAVAVGAVTLAACGGGYGSKGAAPKPVVPVTITTSTAVKSGDTSLGKVLTSSSGLTLYALTNDTKTTSTCTGACAQVWPPLLVDKGWTAAPGLDRSLFSTLVRSDGSRQLVAGQWPLYTFSGDTKAGDVNGEGSGGVWFAAGVNGKLVKSAPATSTMMSAGYGY